MKGWVYIITNKAMPNLVKVGFSTKDPELRAEELHTTGVPYRFVVEYDVLVNEPRDIEQAAHNLLKNHHESKEWFNCSIETAIIAIREAAAGNILLENSRFDMSSEIQEEIDHLKRIGKFAVQDGIAIDTETSLMWLRFAHGQQWRNNTSVGLAKEVNWEAAFEVAKRFNQQGGYAGFTDWRVPAFEELKSLTLGNSIKGNLINTNVFPDSLTVFWSSSDSLGGSGAWIVNFGAGGDARVTK